MSGQQGQDNNDLILVLVVLFAASIFFIDEWLGDYLNYAWFYIKKILLLSMNLLPDYLQRALFFGSSLFDNELEVSQISDQISEYLKFFTATKSNPYESVISGREAWVSSPIEQVLNDPRYSVYALEFKRKVNLFVGYSFLPYVIVFLSWGAYTLYSRKNYTGAMSTESLARQESSLWPCIEPVIYEQPDKEPDLDKGPWAMASRPYEFAEKNGLIEVSGNEFDGFKRVLNKEKTYKVFESQIGAPWKGLSNLSGYRLEMFLIMLAKAERNAELSLKLSDALSRKYTSNKSSFGKKLSKENEILSKQLMKEVLSKYSNSSVLQKIEENYFYERSVFMAMLEAARDDGVLASASFLWLKKQDRLLWYCLNQVGRTAAFVDISGIWSHFLAEKTIGQKIAQPMITNAVYSLDEFLFSTTEGYSLDESIKKE